jgi:hypothetical protein
MREQRRPLWGREQQRWPFRARSTKMSLRSCKTQYRTLGVLLRPNKQRRLRHVPSSNLLGCRKTTMLATAPRKKIPSGSVALLTSCPSATVGRGGFVALSHKRFPSLFRPGFALAALWIHPLVHLSFCLCVVSYRYVDGAAHVEWRYFKLQFLGDVVARSLFRRCSPLSLSMAFLVSCSPEPPVCVIIAHFCARPQNGRWQEQAYL